MLQIQSAVQVHKHLLPLLMYRMALSHRSIRQTWSQYETERMAKSIATKISVTQTSHADSPEALLKTIHLSDFDASSGGALIRINCVGD